MTSNSEWPKVQMACVHSVLGEGRTGSWGRGWQLEMTLEWKTDQIMKGFKCHAWETESSKYIRVSQSVVHGSLALESSRAEIFKL